MSSIITMNEILNNTVDEAYKVLSTNIHHGAALEGIRMICVTSFSPGEGKTTTALNLAMTLAKSGHAVLFVDADMRTPSEGKKFKVTSNKNLSQYYLGNCSLKDIIIKTDVDHLKYVSIGIADNPIGICTDKKFEEFLKAMKSEYDYVIFDTPALGTYVDAAIIAAKCDGSLIIAQADSTQNDQMLRVKAQLEKLNAKIIGIVLNRVSEKDYKHYYLVNENNTDLKKKWWPRKRKDI